MAVLDRIFFVPQCWAFPESIMNRLVALHEAITHEACSHVGDTPTPPPPPGHTRLRKEHLYKGVWSTGITSPHDTQAKGHLYKGVWSTGVTGPQDTQPNVRGISTRGCDPLALPAPRTQGHLYKGQLGRPTVLGNIHFPLMTFLTIISYIYNILSLLFSKYRTLIWKVIWVLLYLAIKVKYPWVLKLSYTCCTIPLLHLTFEGKLSSLEDSSSILLLLLLVLL